MSTLSAPYYWEWQFSLEVHRMSTVCSKATALSVVIDEETQEAEVVIQDINFSKDAPYIFLKDQGVATGYLSGSFAGEKTMAMNVVIQEV
jgi:hypothetical protein